MRRFVFAAALLAVVGIVTVLGSGRATAAGTSVAGLNTGTMRAAFVTCAFSDRPVMFGYSITRCWVLQADGTYRVNCVARYPNGVPICIESYIYAGVPGDANDLPTLYAAFDKNHDDVFDCPTNG